jgi:hypothetical protein
VKCATSELRQILKATFKLLFDSAFSCYDLFAAAYNAWISLGHNAEEAHRRATTSLNACLGLEELSGK